MLRVALTGNIASGKSTVARSWRRLGAHVVDSDELARRAVEPGTAALEAIVRRWGDRVLHEDGRLNRAALGAIVFADPAARDRLERIVHPAVRKMRDEELTAAEATGESLVVVDVPLLYEVGMEQEFDLVVLVHASEAIRLARLVEQRGLAPEQAARMIGAQMPSERKRETADLVIENEDTLEELEVRAREVWTALLSRAEPKHDV
jgi:dephospho-CoA kinase